MDDDFDDIFGGVSPTKPAAPGGAAAAASPASSDTDAFLLELDGLTSGAGGSGGSGPAGSTHAADDFADIFGDSPGKDSTKAKPAKALSAYEKVSNLSSAFVSYRECRWLNGIFSKSRRVLTISTLAGVVRGLGGAGGGCI
jgi:hypothetical protein